MRPHRQQPIGLLCPWDSLGKNTGMGCHFLLQYLRLLIFLLAILILAWASSSPAFHMMYSAYKLNRQGDNIQPWHSFPSLNQSIVPCPVLTIASWLAYRFLRRQVRWSGIPSSWRIFQFVVIHTVKGFGVVSEVEVDIFLRLSCFFYDPTDDGDLMVILAW